MLIWANSIRTIWWCVCDELGHPVKRKKWFISNFELELFWAALQVFISKKERQRKAHTYTPTDRLHSMLTCTLKSTSNGRTYDECVPHVPHCNDKATQTITYTSAVFCVNSTKQSFVCYLCVLFSPSQQRPWDQCIYYVRILVAQIILFSSSRAVLLCISWRLGARGDKIFIRWTRKSKLLRKKANDRKIAFLFTIFSQFRIRHSAFFSCQAVCLITIHWSWTKIHGVQPSHKYKQKINLDVHRCALKTS